MIATCICIQKSRPRSHHYSFSQEVLNSCIVLVQSMVVALLASLYYAFQNLWYPVTTDLQEVSSSITIIILPLLMGWVEHNLSALCERHCIGDVRHNCNGKVSTLQHITKLCTSYFSFFYLSYPFLHDTHVHSRFTKHLGKHS